jgi:E-phenylitaconyl-CoA hydratase
MILSGEPIAAATAERWGLINEIVPGDQLVERVEELARRIAANAPIAVQTAKQLLTGGNAVTLESIAAATNAFTKDAAEGLAAFREKRSPNFQGL